jgi:hypothetical protein
LGVQERLDIVLTAHDKWSPLVDIPWLDFEYPGPAIRSGPAGLLGNERKRVRFV